ncbi:hypothetical protein GRI39_04255 [Altererythrobacter indicus]|uniref:Uncharacterized protein n=1 Tax=Altericroceibacterium indicum TaxID=374177 RepID=A0A845A6T1_9SPHN|nr:hypothetical protein [Altericroceibacterium indicum]MXP25257.1 hypothetical protein [Altericroceibacterium indicum]
MNIRLGSIVIAGCGALTLASSPAIGQMTDREVLSILRECAKVADPTARLACFDNNLRSGPSSTAMQQHPKASPADTPPIHNQRSVSEGFGANDVRHPDRFAKPPADQQSLTARVASVSKREPGIYLVTLEGGAQWLFSESVPFSFNPPRKGSQVSINKASLGSYLMSVGKQSAVRVKRIQ